MELNQNNEFINPDNETVVKKYVNAFFKNRASGTLVIIVVVLLIIAMLIINKVSEPEIEITPAPPSYDI